jgi:hypothetical protein
MKSFGAIRSSQACVLPCGLTVPIDELLSVAPCLRESQKASANKSVRASGRQRRLEATPRRSALGHPMNAPWEEKTVGPRRGPPTGTAWKRYFQRRNRVWRGEGEYLLAQKPTRADDHSRQPCASRTAIDARKMLFHVSAWNITSFGNMQPSQQM